MIVHAAKHYGVDAVGVTLAAEQAAWARQAVERAGLSDRVRVVLSDYRDFRAPGQFDKAVSVGMGEHVRPEHLVAGQGQGVVFRFKVETVEALGADSMVHGAFGGGTVVARVEGHSTPQVGAELVFTAMPGKLYFFDTATGKRLRA